MANFIAQSSWGTLVAEVQTGVVDKYASRYVADPAKEQAVPLRNIYRLDVDEWRKAWPNEELAGTEQDILDFGFWYTVGGQVLYEPPAHAWREEIRKDLKAGKIHELG
jgi:hypothetical protein